MIHRGVLLITVFTKDNSIIICLMYIKVSPMREGVFPETTRTGLAILLGTCGVFLVLLLAVLLLAYWRYVYISLSGCYVQSVFIIHCKKLSNFLSVSHVLGHPAGHLRDLPSLAAGGASAGLLEVYCMPMKI